MKATSVIGVSRGTSVSVGAATPGRIPVPSATGVASSGEEASMELGAAAELSLALEGAPVSSEDDTAALDSVWVDPGTSPYEQSGVDSLGEEA